MVGGKDVSAASDVLLQDVVLNRARQAAQVDALPPRNCDVQRQQDHRGRVDRHRRGHTAQRDAVKKLSHIFHGIDGDTYASHLASRQRVIGVIAHLCGEVERDAQAADALRQEVLVPGIRLLRCAEAGVLAHRPQPPAVHRLLNPASVWELPRQTDNMRVGVGQVVGGDEGSLAHRTPFIVALTQKIAR